MSQAVLHVVARAEHRGLRADRVLAELIAAQRPATSRGEVQRWLTAGRIESAGRVVGAKDKVAVGQSFSVSPLPPPSSHAVPEEGVEFTVVHEDPHLVVVDKPAGLVVHPARGHESGTLVNGLLARGLFARELLEGIDDADTHGSEEHDRPGIVHRIDKETSGLLVVARTAAAREHLKAQFAAHSIERVYHAICVGECPSQTFSTLHGRHPSDRIRFSSKVREGKRAVTHVRLERSFGGRASHLSCRLETGRTHQIRVHLADQGTPLLADALYGRTPKDAVVRQAAQALGRHALHAGVLGFVHPHSGETVRFESPLPDDFARALQVLDAAR